MIVVVALNNGKVEGITADGDLSIEFFDVNTNEPSRNAKDYEDTLKMDSFKQLTYNDALERWYIDR